MSAHKLNENMTIKMNNNKDSMLKDDQDNIQAKKSTLRQKIYSNTNIHVRVSRIIMARVESLC